MWFSNRVGRADFFFNSLPVFDLYVSMKQCHSVKQTTLNINTSILYPGLFLLYVIDIPVSVLRSPWKKVKSDIIHGSFPMFKCVNLTCSPVCMGPGPPPPKKSLGYGLFLGSGGLLQYNNYFFCLSRVKAHLDRSKL